MPRARVEPLYVGIKGHVIAMQQDTGVELWRTKLEGARMRAHDFVHLLRDRDSLFASYNGEVYCLDPKTGEVRWHNQLRGLGTGLTSLDSDTRDTIERVLTRLLDRVISSALTNALPAIPIPSFELPASLATYGLPAGAELGLVSPSLSSQPPHFVLRGGFAVR